MLVPVYVLKCCLPESFVSKKIIYLVPLFITGDVSFVSFSKLKFMISFITKVPEHFAHRLRDNYGPVLHSVIIVARVLYRDI